MNLGMRSCFATNCLMKSFCCKFSNVEAFVAKCGMRSFCCELWNEKFLLRIVE